MAPGNGLQNYFNYFTEIEEHFQKARGTGLFLLSPIDWALIETWKEAGIPLEAVLRGIDRAFEKWHSRKRKGRMVNSLAYCSQEVMAAAQEQSAAATAPEGRSEAHSAMPAGELAAALARHAGLVRDKCPEIAASLDEMRAAAETGIAMDLEEVERRLTVLEEKMLSSLIAGTPEDVLLALRRELDGALQPYRSKMTADQIVMLEKQFFRNKVLETAGLPRLSLFHWQ